MLPFADLTLLSANVAAAIVFNTILSIWILKEQFVPWYDLPAIILIAGAGFTIAFNAFRESVEYSADEIEELLVAPATLGYGILALLLVLGQSFVVRTFTTKVREFEEDAIAYENAPIRLVTEEEELNGGNDLIT